MSAIDFQRWFDKQCRSILPQQEETPANSKIKSYHPPVVDDDQLEYMSFLLEEAHELNRAVLVTYAGRYSPLQFYGRVAKVHPYEGWIILANGELRKKISYSRLMDVDWM
ncbi:YolD-like family protein [Hazenella coriacea]|uniref:YolD-like protein n=1 Tax=Hazenella coriacea TaxID=1179467 RepID=A0A4R3L9B0_9BACL|nr:YolD-like family protein [Hazenella coriacea]TCS95690.1 YolD-like protein [Hazenella coriacea]